jgi:hypothetical protein
VLPSDVGQAQRDRRGPAGGSVVWKPAAATIATPEVRPSFAPVIAGEPAALPGSRQRAVRTKLGTAQGWKQQVRCTY